jgi:NAD(P)-dependent dehydrogenase (short-subunit alcohol dehydrogenase family)
MRLAEKTAIITGAGYGIGRGIAIRFANEGADIAVGYGHNREKAEETAELVRSTGRQALVIKCNVRSSVEVGSMVDTTLKTLGKIDIMVNNAGIVRVTPFLDISEEEWDTVVGTDLKGCFLCAQRAAQAMVRRGLGGKIINIGSTQGEHPLPGRTHYAAAKTGLLGMARVMAFELAEHAICVNTIEPGATLSEMTRPFLVDSKAEAKMLEGIPMHRLGTPEDIASLAVFLASSESDYITGAVIVVDGGLLTSPNLV